MKQFTIIIPIFNEVDSIFNLLSEVEKVFKSKNIEILIVDDGSSDDFKEKRKFLKKNFKIKVHSRNLGKCKAMLTGIQSASNKIVGILDGDGQNPPSELKKLFNFWIKIPQKDKKFALICGNRISSQDTLIKRLSSKLANKFRKFILKDDCNDTACALKVFSKSDYLKIPYFKNMHRFLPALFKMNNGKIFNIPVQDRRRFAGKSKYNFNNRFWVGIKDLYNVWVLVTFKKGDRL